MPARPGCSRISVRASVDGLVQRVTWRALWIDFTNPQPAPADVTSTFQGTGVFSTNGLYNVKFYEYSVDLSNDFYAFGGMQYWFSVLAETSKVQSCVCSPWSDWRRR